MKEKNIAECILELQESYKIVPRRLEKNNSADEQKKKTLNLLETFQSLKFKEKNISPLSFLNF